MCCHGHHHDSRIYPTYPPDEATAVSLTNREVMELLDPRTWPLTTPVPATTASSSSNGHNYPVYHHFRWDHCAAAGVPFEYEGKKANAGENKGAGGDETRRRRVKVGGERGGRGGEGDDRLRDTKQE